MACDNVLLRFQYSQKSFVARAFCRVLVNARWCFVSDFDKLPSSLRWAISNDWGPRLVKRMF